MKNVKSGLRKAMSLLFASLMSVSVFTVTASVRAEAVTYSEMSALDQYAYGGDDLGAVYTKSSTTFKVWAPTASKVQLKRYKTGSDTESGAGVIGIVDMTSQSQGIWSATVQGDIAGTYYTYLVTVDNTTRETVDIYAKSTGVNGMRGMVIDLDSTDPVGWENDKRVSCPNQTDAVIWEAHVRDFSSSSDSGMKNKGKFLAFTETGTTVNGDGVHPTGIDYLADLGVTHVHLLPVYDYGSVDETKLSTDQFNWGYDPMNYNTPEGSYSTNPYDGNVRVNEFKQMVQALHKKNIGVVMDVVYNHTYAGNSNINDWFNYTVPNYYYRQNAKGTFSNASGCGNETASDRAMYQKFMVDSLVYWATEYHLDGFRFDLMGIHDVDTMNKIRTELNKINPDILIYGEPWWAESSPCPKATAVQGNMYLVDAEVAAFNDKVRDAIKGSCFNAADPGFIQGAVGFETALKGGIQANSTDMAGTGKWSKQPSQTVTYTSAHDNYTLYDKLVKSCKGGSGYGNRYDDLVKMNKMAGGIILTSQGMSFFQAGEEFARSKYGDENSYKSSTSINQLKWANTVTYSDLTNYYKGLIEIRKAYAPFRDPTNVSNNTIYFSWGTNCPDKVVAFTMYNKYSTGKEWNFAAVIHNANTTSQTVKLMTYDGVTLPSQWVVVADGDKAGTVSLGTTGSTVTVPARSTMVLIDKTSFDNTDLQKKCTVTVNHIDKSTGNTVSTEKLTGEAGASYTTSPSNTLISQGYTVSSVTGSTTGTFSEEGAVVNYYYTLDMTRYGTVTVKYIDSNTKETIADTETKTGLIGSSYSFTAKSIRGYELADGQASTQSGTYAAGTKEITFRYVQAEETGITIHYYNSNSWTQVAMYVYTEVGSTATLYSGPWPGTLMTTDGNGWFTGKIDTVDSALFIANNNDTINGAQDPSKVGQKGYEVSGEVWVKNSMVYPTGKVTVKYVTDTGDVLASSVLKGMADGSNSYSTTAKTFDGYTLKSTPSNASGKYTKADITVTYTYKSNEVVPTVLTNNSTIARTSVPKDTSVSVKGAASGGDGSYKYAFYYKKSTSAAWATIGELYGNTTEVSFAPAAAATYYVKVNVKDGTGKIVTKQFTLKSTTPTSSDLQNTSTHNSTGIVKGTAIKITGKATGGASGYKYGFYYKKTTSKAFTTLGTEYGSATTATFTPGSDADYNIRINVKDSSGTIVTKQYKILRKGTTALTNNSTVSTTSPKVGDTVTITGAASGSTTPYKFAYYYKKSSASSYTTIGTEFGTATTAKFKVTAAATYNVKVKVKDSIGNIVEKLFTVKATAASSGGVLANSSSISATTVAKGTTVTVTAKASGGTTPYSYAVYYKKSTSSNWTAIGTEYGTATTYKFTPASAATYNVMVKVMDNTGETATKNFTVTST